MYIYVPKDVANRGYFSKPKGLCEQYSLSTALQYSTYTATMARKLSSSNRKLNKIFATSPSDNSWPIILVLFLFPESTIRIIPALEVRLSNSLLLSTAGNEKWWLFVWHLRHAFCTMFCENLHTGLKFENGRDTDLTKHTEVFLSHKYTWSLRKVNGLLSSDISYMYCVSSTSQAI